jgi:DNA primase
MSTDAGLVRSRADLVGIAARYGVKLRKSGVQLAGLCPFHNEKSPSFYIDPEKQVFKCHGCGVRGDVFNFVQQIERVDFQERWRSLQI